MQETSRRRYLALLGIDLWLPRDAVDAVAEAPSAEPPVVPSPAVAAPPPPAAEAVPAAPEPVPAATPPPAAAAAVAGDVGPLGCSLLALPDGLLVIAAYVTPQAPGLSGPEHALLASIAAALAPGARLPAPDEFRWPPPGVRLPAVARPGAGADALIGLLAEQRRRRNLRDLLLLGESLAAPVQEAAVRLGLNAVVAPSLSAMLADPARKRACWDVARPLRRGGEPG
ncbi:MAG: hypothetical protein ACOY33_02025 [Pseudomonadota bacterium]